MLLYCRCMKAQILEDFGELIDEVAKAEVSLSIFVFEFLAPFFLVINLSFLYIALRCLLS